MPRLSVGMSESVNVGFLGPLTGHVESWGLPGLNGCRIWEDWLNQAGGLLVGGRRYPIKIHAYDCGYEPERALEGAVELLQKHDIKLMLMLGGDTFAPVQDFLMRNKVLTSTLLPTDLSPDTPYLIAPSEAHPIQNVTGVAWLAENRPELKTVALCSQADLLGLPAQAVYRAAFKGAQKSIVKEVQYDPDTGDAGTIVDEMLESGADILCWCSSYAPMVHAMTEYAYTKGFKGQIISCTMDGYDRLVERTSVNFMEGVIFQFPDFDDPLLREAFLKTVPRQQIEDTLKDVGDVWSIHQHLVSDSVHLRGSCGDQSVLAEVVGSDERADMLLSLPLTTFGLVVHDQCDLDDHVLRGVEAGGLDVDAVEVAHRHSPSESKLGHGTKDQTRASSA